jgi:hypothetical protein
VLAPPQAHHVGLVEGDIPELAVVLHERLARLARVVAQVLGHEPGAPHAPRPVAVRVVALDARDALARDLVQHQGPGLELDDLPLLRVPPVVPHVQRLVEVPPERRHTLEPRQKILRAVVRVVVAQNKHVRIQPENKLHKLVPWRQPRRNHPGIATNALRNHLHQPMQPKLANHCKNLQGEERL